MVQILCHELRRTVGHYNRQMKHRIARPVFEISKVLGIMGVSPQATGTMLKCKSWGTWVAQLAERLTSAQVMISQLVDSSPVSGPVLTAQGLEPASDSVSPSLSTPPPLTFCLSLSK